MDINNLNGNINQETLLRKVDHLLDLIMGSGENAPGLMSRVAAIERVLYGRDATGGMVQQLVEIRRIKTWVLGSLSALFGSGLTVLIQYVIKHI
jgi:hypothetical protein